MMDQTNQINLYKKADHALTNNSWDLINNSLYDMAAIGDVEYVQKLLDAGGSGYELAKGRTKNALCAAFDNRHAEVFAMLQDAKTKQLDLSKDAQVNRMFTHLLGPADPENYVMLSKSKADAVFYAQLLKHYEKEARVHLFNHKEHAVAHGYLEVLKVMLTLHPINFMGLNKLTEVASMKDQPDIFHYLQGFKVLRTINKAIEATSKDRYDGIASLSSDDLIYKMCTQGQGNIQFQVPQFVYGLYSNRAYDVLQKIHDKVQPNQIIFSNITFADILHYTKTQNLYAEINTKQALEKAMSKKRRSPLRRF